MLYWNGICVFGLKIDEGHYVEPVNLNSIVESRR